MGIKASCSNCGKTYNLKDEQAGKKVRCVDCKSIFSVPANEHEETDGQHDKPTSRNVRARETSRRDKKRDPEGARNKKKIGLLIGLIAGLIVVAVGAYFVFFNGSPAPSGNEQAKKEPTNPSTPDTPKKENTKPSTKNTPEKENTKPVETPKAPVDDGVCYKTRLPENKKKYIELYGGVGTEQALQDGLAWLVANQTYDGSWDAMQDKAKTMHKTAVTAMALLAFLGDGRDESDPKYGPTIKKAVDWLLENVDSATGKFKPSSVLYEQALVAMALNEAYGMNIKRVKDKAIKATQFIIAGQTAKGGWLYQPAPGVASGDSSITGFQVQALKQALNAKLGIDDQVEASLKKAREWVEYANAGNGYTGYTGPVKGSISLCAAGGLMRVYLRSDKSDKQLENAVQNIGRELPDVPIMAVGGETENRTNTYYMYYGNLLSFQWQEEQWKTWNETMKKVLLANQCREEGDNKGSWKPDKDAYSGSWGRVGATAVSCLCLEVYYRYDRLLK